MLEKPILVRFLRCTNFNNTFLVRTRATLVHSFYSVAQDSRASQSIPRSDMHFQTSAFPCFAFKLWPGEVGASWEISFWKNANSPTLQTHVVLIGPSISRVGGWWVKYRSYCEAQVSDISALYNFTPVFQRVSFTCVVSNFQLNTFEIWKYMETSKLLKHV